MTPTQGSLLFVDDDDVTRDLMTNYLERNGFDVTGVSSGEEGLAAIEQGRHELVLLDILLEGLDGLEVLTEIRRRHSPADLPVVMATSMDQSGDVVKALKLGANDYVTKPFDYPVVLARVQTHLSLKRKNAELETANRRMKRDLDAAARIQAALLPAELPEMSGARFAWQFKPCSELAGDLLNIFPLDQRRVAVYVLDVVGHGVAAALLAVMVNRVLGQLRASGWSLAAPADVADHLNREFPWDPQTEQYFTLLYGVLRLDTGEFRFVTAGHPGPIHAPGTGTPRSIKLPASPIGLAEVPYVEHTLNLAQGDRLFLYSDGLVDARNSSRKAFGETRLLERIDQSRGTPLPEAIATLLRATQDWCGVTLPHDDITILGVERV